MAAQRKSIDCRDYPSDKNCSLKISGTEQEVLEAAVQHAVSAHGHENTPEFREQIKSMLKNEPDRRKFAVGATLFLPVGSVVDRPLRSAPPAAGARYWKVSPTTQRRQQPAGSAGAEERAIAVAA